VTGYYCTPTGTLHVVRDAGRRLPVRDVTSEPRTLRDAEEPDRAWPDRSRRTRTFARRHLHLGGSVAEWSACWTQAQKGPGSNRSRDAVG